MPTLKRAIDSIAAAKLNVLHWHLTDAQSFPLLLNSAPQLAQLVRPHTVSLSRWWNCLTGRQLSKQSLIVVVWCSHDYRCLACLLLLLL